MCSVISKKLLIEKDVKFTEEVIIKHILIEDDYDFIEQHEIKDYFLFYKNLIGKIILFRTKYPEDKLINITTDGIVNSNERNLLNDILTRVGKADPLKSFERLKVLGSVLFMNIKLDSIIESTEIDSITHDSIANKFRVLLKDFDNIISNQDNSIIDSNNVHLHYKKIFQKNIKTIATGVEYIDRLTGGGFNSGDLIICAARPGIGKTTFAINLIINNMDELEDTKKKALVVTPDMSVKYLYYRLISCTYGFSMNEVMKMDQETLLNYVKEFPIKITETNTYEDIEEIIKISHQDISVIFIDYIQAIVSTKNKNLVKHEQIGAITIDLKKLAKKYGITLIFLAQLSRESEKTGQGNNSNATLKDSGYLEQEADLILLLSKFETKNMYGEVVEQSYNNKLVVSVVKNRHGPLGKCNITVSGDNFRIN